MNLFFVFLRGGNRCLPQHRGDRFSFITITPMCMCGNLKLQQTRADEILELVNWSQHIL